MEGERGKGEEGAEKDGGKHKENWGENGQRIKEKKERKWQW